jgi:hypothetical protein
LARGLTQSGFARNGKPAPRNYSPAIAGLVVQTSILGGIDTHD